MRKLLLLSLFALLLLSGSSVSAQIFQFGVQGGMDMTRTYAFSEIGNTDPSTIYDPMLSYNVNAYVGYKSAGFWGVSFEPGFIKKGKQQKLLYPAGKEEVAKWQMNYIQLPVLANFYIKEKFSVSVGPEFAYLVSAYGKTKEIKNDMASFYDNNFELSGIVGLNYSFHKYLDVGARFSHAFTLNKELEFINSNGEIAVKTKEYNQYAQLFLRFKI